jgi:lipoate-protein ligase A
MLKYLIDNLNQTDPAINLATEEYIVRNFDIAHDYVFLYTNQPALVVGRHQNVFEEVNLPYVLERGIPTYRRISGGGTVFHDRGNLNFSFITRYEKFKFNNYRYFNQPIVEFLNHLKVPAEQTKGNDIIVKDKKISGNAQFTSKDRMMSHGTLLYNSDLEQLSNGLKVSGREITSRATKSRRSSVTNISSYLNDIMTIEQFRDLLVQYLFPGAGDIPRMGLQQSDREQILELAEDKYRQWDWTFGESPDFTVKSSIEMVEGEIHCHIKVSKGRIKEILFEGPGIKVSEAVSLSNLLEGERYYPEDVLEVLKGDNSLNGEQIQSVKGLLF